jgi:hypothetical protein
LAHWTAGAHLRHLRVVAGTQGEGISAFTKRGLTWTLAAAFREELGAMPAECWVAAPMNAALPGRPQDRPPAADIPQDGPRMNSTFSIARSGMQAAQFSLDVSAHNIANALTPGFRRQQVVPQTQAEGGVTVTLSQAAQEGDAVAEDLVQQRLSGHLFAANLATLRTADRMLGGLLDITA